MPDAAIGMARSITASLASDPTLAIASLSPDGTILRANDKFGLLFDARVSEVVGLHHKIFVTETEAASEAYRAFWAALRRGEGRSAEYRRLRGDGSELWMEAIHAPLLDRAGEPYEILTIVSDITARKRAWADHQGQVTAINMSQCVIHFTVDGTIIDANQNFLDALGYRREEVLGRHHRMFVPPEVAEGEDYARFWQTLRGGTFLAETYKRIGKGGREVWLQASYNPILDLNGKPFKIVKYATDVTRESLRRADAQGQIAAIHKSTGAVAFDLDGIIIDANQNFLDALGYRREEVVGRHHRMFVPPEVAEAEDYARFWQTLRGGTFLAATYKRVGKGGREVWLQASYNPILDLNGKPFKVVKYATDITAEIRLAEAFRDVERQAQHDMTTALPNRTRLSSFMTAGLGTPGARLIVLYLDLDGFKPINDLYGHATGDRVLREVAHRLRRCMTNDQLVARVGGDEFVVAAPNLPQSGIDALCQRLIDAVTAPIRHDGGELTVGLSIGVAVSPDDATTPDDLLRCADQALYRSKAHGGRCYSVFAAEASDPMPPHRRRTGALRRDTETVEGLPYRPWSYAPSAGLAAIPGRHGG